MRYQLSELIDLAGLQRLMESLYRATGINHALIDNDSRVLTAVGWEPVCTRFHRTNPGTCARCLESDRYILSHLHDGPYVGYACPNGLVDYATPVIIDGEHVANMFTGQMFHEPPDMGFFRRQAVAFGFAEDEYLTAVRRVRVIPRERMPDIMAFLVGLAQMLGLQGLTRLRQLEAEKDLRQFNEDLALRVRQRTEEVSEKNHLLSLEIAAQQRVEAALRQEKRFSDDLISSLPGIFYVLDTQGRFTRWNPAFCEVTRYSGEEMGRLNALDLFEGDAKALIAERIGKVFENGEAEAEAPLLTKDGRRIAYHFTGRRTVIDDAVYLVGLGIDISERLAAERRRRESEDKLRGLFELSPLGIALTDMDGRYIEFNEAFRQICGYPADELKQLDCWTLTPKKYEADEARQLDALARTGRYGPYEKECRRADGTLVPLRLNGIRVTGADGRHCIWSIVEDITTAKEHERKLERMAHFDVLTGVPNRVLLTDHLEEAIARTRRDGTMMLVCYLDLDGFKPINDHLGHDIGDEVLVEIAHRLKDCLRSKDTVARIGGDEFVLLLLDLSRIEECDAALRRILDVVRRPLTVGGQVRTLSASLGATVFPIDGADGDTLIRHADQAMYLAKQAGKNRYQLFDPEQDRRTRAHLEHISSVGAALHNQEFELHYQPKVNMRLGRVFGAEALIRWRHPKRGLLLPGDFLPAMESSDQIVAIGDWVIAAALDQLAAWLRAGLDLTVSVNIAARHLLRHDFVARLRAHLAAQPDVPRDRLELEVLETAAIEDIQHVARVIRDCREMGVSFALDDFGTGYSSLAYLKQLPVETLKIDQTFVRGMLDNPEDIAIVEGVIGLSGVFRRSVVAEGVETVEHGARLLDLGCDLAQGYGIGRPMPAAELPSWIRSWVPHPTWTNEPAPPLLNDFGGHIGVMTECTAGQQ
ncbi:MAG TPA: EAL domain-containing protein [Azospirillum sp.]|nr:EAL domain-containing protein [Azospirillum sp.]